MKVKYNADTDTLHIELRNAPAVDTRDLGEHAILDVDAQGNVCAVTIAHASEQGAAEFEYEHVSA